MASPSELSAQNPRIRDAAKLAQKKFRRQTGHALLEGARLVADALDAGAEIVEVFCTAAFLASAPGRTLDGLCGDRVTLVTEAAAARLSATRAPQGVFAVVAFRPPTLADVDLLGAPLVLVADGIADPGNLGTMIRSAAALGARAVVAAGASCDVLNPKVVRATMGAVFRVPVVVDVTLAEAVAELRRRGLQVVAAVAGGGQQPWRVDFNRPVALLIGSEAEGLPEDTLAGADARVTIPMAGGAESLNAAAAVAALLHEAARQRATQKEEGS